MKLSKTKLAQYISYINRSKKKRFTCQDLSNSSGDTVEKVRAYIVEYNPLINFDYDFDLNELLPVLKNDLEEAKKMPTKKRNKEIRTKDLLQYDGVLDYIYKNMCDSGGLIDTGYKLDRKEIKALRKLLKFEEKELNEEQKKNRN